MCRAARRCKLSQPQQLMAQERKIVEEAYAGDIIGVFDPGHFLHRGYADHCLPRNLLSRESLPSRRSISRESVRWIP